MSSNNQNNLLSKIIYIVILVAILFAVDFFKGDKQPTDNNLINDTNITNSVSISGNTIAGTDIPVYAGKRYIKLNNNQPEFTEKEKTNTKAFEKYSNLDELGRCGVAYANLCQELMPAQSEEREDIHEIRPSGWQVAKYEGLVEQDMLYNRSHLIAWKLGAENANEKNLITGTRYFNAEGMLQFEDRVAGYLHRKKTRNNHVLYRVTPVFEGDNLVATGVQMEAYSVEDQGKGICFNVFVYNVQPGITIDYATGKSKLADK